MSTIQSSLEATEPLWMFLAIDRPVPGKYFSGFGHMGYQIDLPFADSISNQYEPHNILCI